MLSYLLAVSTAVLSAEMIGRLCNLDGELFTFRRGKPERERGSSDPCFLLRQRNRGLGIPSAGIPVLIPIGVEAILSTVGLQRPAQSINKFFLEKLVLFQKKCFFFAFIF